MIVVKRKDKIINFVDSPQKAEMYIGTICENLSEDKHDEFTWSEISDLDFRLWALNEINRLNNELNAVKSMVHMRF